MAKLIDVKVKFAAGKSFPGRGGKKRKNVVFEPIAGGEEISVWFDEGDDRYCSLRKGDQAQVLEENNRFTLIQYDEEGDTLEAGGADAPGGKPRNMDEAHKVTVHESIRYRARVIATCHMEIHKLFCNEKGQLVITEETLQKYATTIYLDIKNQL